MRKAGNKLQLNVPFILFAWFASLSNSYAQKSDTLNAIRLANDSWKVVLSNLDSGFYYAFSGLSLSEELQFPRGIIENSLALSECYRQAGIIDRALNYSYRALETANKSNLNSSNGSNIFNSFGMIYQITGDYDLALINFLKGYELSKGKANAHLNRDDASFFNNVGTAYMLNNQLDSAEQYLKRSLELNIGLENKWLIAFNHFNLGKLEYTRRNFDKALPYLEMSRRESQEVSNKSLEANSLKEASKVFLAIGDNRNALKFSLNALQLAKTSKVHWAIQNAYEMVYKSYLAQGDTKNACKYLIFFTAAKDSLNTFRLKLAQESYFKEFQFRERENEVNLLKQQATKSENEIEIRNKQLRVQQFALLSTFLFVILLIVIAVAQVRRNRLKKAHIKALEHINLEIAWQKSVIEKGNLQLALSLNRSKVDPHFIFNVLNSIALLVLEKKPHEASDYLGSFSRLMRYVLEKSSLDEVSLREEIEMLELYISLEQLRLDNKFEYKVEVNAPLDAKLPAMLLQPYVENAILHGLSNSNSKHLFLKLFFKEDVGKLTVQIVNNGSGRKEKSFSAHNPLGSSLGQQRLKLLSQIDDNAVYKVFIEDLNLDSSDPILDKVRVTIELPLKAARSPQLAKGI